MKYDVSKNQVKEILLRSNIMNTINGGMSQSQTTITRQNDHYLVKVKMPGVPVSNMKVDVVDQWVTITFQMNVEIGEDRSTIPYPIAVIPISNRVDYQGISANEVNQELHIIIPFNELTNGYHRSININR